MNSDQAIQSAWRQIVDLIGRRRAPPLAEALDLLEEIRPKVPQRVREASARALEYADPPEPLVRILGTDLPSVAIPVMRGARLTSKQWIAMLPSLSPGARQALRHRRDLGPAVARALEAYGAVDFVLPDERTDRAAQDASMVPVAAAEPVADLPVAETAPEPMAVAEIADDADRSIFVDWTRIESAAALPVQQEAAEKAPVVEDAAVTVAEPVSEEAMPVADASALVEEPVEAVAPVDSDAAMPRYATFGPEAAIAQFEGTLIVERGPGGDQGPQPDAASRYVAAAAESALISFAGFGTARRPDAASVATPEEPPALPEPGQAEAPPTAPRLTAYGASKAAQPEPEGPFRIADVVERIDRFWKNRERRAPDAQGPAPRAEAFSFETDASGTIRWVDGIERAAIVGMTLDLAAVAGGSGVDGVAAGAFRRRAGFANARLCIEGESDAAGSWRISAIPVFDTANGRFTGYRGTGRRPRADEQSQLPEREDAGHADSLRQLVHELRTPTNAIAGFAEMIETQMLGPVSEIYRTRATEIREQAGDLLGAIEDLDLAARIESHALALDRARVSLRPLLARVADDLKSLCELRGAMIALPIGDHAVLGDPRAVERMVSRLTSTLVSASGEGERVGMASMVEGDEVALRFDRPAALRDYRGDALLSLDDEIADDPALLGTGFALRLVRNLARELGGSLTIASESLTLRLPASVDRVMEHANRH